MSHSSTLFGPKIFAIFRCRKIFHPKSCEIARKSARPDDVRPWQHSGRSSQGRLSTGTPQGAEFVAFFDAFRTERNFEIFRCRKIFRPESREIARKSAGPDDARPSQHSSRSSQGWLSIGTTRRAGFVAFFDALRTQNFENFPPPQNFAPEIVQGGQSRQTLQQKKSDGSSWSS